MFGVWGGGSGGIGSGDHRGLALGCEVKVEAGGVHHGKGLEELMLKLLGKEFVVVDGIGDEGVEVLELRRDRRCR